MSMWLSKIVVVDGVEISVSAEGGSAKEALSIIDAAAEELGAAPAPAEGAGKGEGRKRRTKAEMDAARAALAPAAAPGVSPLSGPAEPARVFAPPAQTRPETRTEDVVWGEAPALPQEARTVGFEPPPAAPAFEPPPPVFDAPPPPVKTMEETLREQIDSEMRATIALQPAWEKLGRRCAQQGRGAVRRHERPDQRREPEGRAGRRADLPTPRRGRRQEPEVI